ncbi:unnamed protein product [Sphenostylis stenocarpa]|uniref:PGG domain-containing protein n=1 Tax=Sphenostylis stenocarpa TaxID=92480 RepID=A0AA86VHI4_9FABA|nr:unnamed protein product [Sphenostylis stenocarpa]
MDVDGDSVPHDVTKQQIKQKKQIQQNQQQNNTKESAAKNEEEETPFVIMERAGMVDLVKELQNITKIECIALSVFNQPKESAAKEEEKESAFLTAARNGITEIVHALQFKIPSVVHETNSKNQNVLLVAAKNKQVNVVQLLRKNLEKNVFRSLISEMDNRENTVLHLAAGASSNETTWKSLATVMQMMWDIKWYQYISDLVPEEFIYIRNKDYKTAWEIYEAKHKDKAKECSENLKDLSNSGSVVAALIAGVSFATSSTVPGGTDKGKPIFGGHPAFNVFATASLIGLVFSITALVMFLAILTSSKQAQDFRFSLPLKLSFGLSSLFASVVAMLVSFGAAQSFVLEEKSKIILLPVYATTLLPLALYECLITQSGTDDTDMDHSSLFREWVLEGKWLSVLALYISDSDCHKIKINEGRGTALHVAVNDGNVRFVNNLVEAILSHEGREGVRSDSALRSTNERGDTPLHLAASRGFIPMCKCIIGENKERNEFGMREGTLLCTLLAGETETFVYLNNVSKELDVTLRNYHGDTILHQAIRREFLDLAILITHCYPELVDTRNEVGDAPLKILASKPSAFQSGSNLPWWKRILYCCMYVGPLDVGKYEDPEPGVSIELESYYEEGKHATSVVGFVKSAVRLAFKFLSLSRLGVTAPGM